MSGEPAPEPCAWPDDDPDAPWLPDDGRDIEAVDLAGEWL